MVRNALPSRSISSRREWGTGASKSPSDTRSAAWASPRTGRANATATSVPTASARPSVRKPASRAPRRTPGNAASSCATERLKRTVAALPMLPPATHVGSPRTSTSRTLSVSGFPRPPRTAAPRAPAWSESSVEATSAPSAPRSVTSARASADSVVASVASRKRSDPTAPTHRPPLSSATRPTARGIPSW